MCAIVAILHFDSSPERVDHDELLLIRDRMTSRGPDGAGEWYSPDQKVGLAHRRLSIIDLSDAGAQPMISAGGGVWSVERGAASREPRAGNAEPGVDRVITFNGEIYNYRELRAQLESRGYIFRSASDTEVLLHLYEEYGEGMVDHLRGMYAFAIWDSEKGALFLARDPYGIKPLYYSQSSGSFRAASQVKALLSSKRIPIDPDPAGHAGFFIWGHVPEPYTLYKNIRSLEPGTTLTVSASGEKTTRVFSRIEEVFNRSTQREQRNGGQASALSPTNLLREVLLDSVKHHLIADVPVGVFLSSGLDSTTLTALAAEIHPHVRTITLGFEEFRGTPQDEVPLAEAVARHYGTHHQTVWITLSDFEEQYEQLLSEMDQPTTDGVNTYFVSLAAKRAGLKVAISGVGGDELFGGYPSFSEIPRITHRLEALAATPGLGRLARVISAPIIKRTTSPKYASLLEYGGSYGGAYLLRRGMFMPWEVSKERRAERGEGSRFFAEGLEELRAVERLNETIKGIESPRARVSALESCWYMRNQLLRDTDWASMAHSLEIRTPLVDIELLRQVAPFNSSPTPYCKRDMASTPARPLPDVILNRPKTGFSIPVRDWLKKERRAGSGERGLRGWARQVYSAFSANT